MSFDNITRRIKKKPRKFPPETKWVAEIETALDKKIQKKARATRASVYSHALAKVRSRVKKNPAKILSRSLPKWIKIPVTLLETDGRTIWVHGPEGATILRIQFTEKLEIHRCDTSPVSHMDLSLPTGVLCVAKKDLK